VTTSAAGDLCRLVVVAPTRSAELALPANVPLADLVPGLVAHVSGGVAEESVGRGVVLQRLGEPPLDEDDTPAGLGLRDGDTLYLRPREAPMPEVVHDDLIDGVATRLRLRAGRWRPATTRRMLLGLAAAVLLPGLALLVESGPHGLRVLVAGAAGAALLAGAFAAARAFGDRAAGMVLGCAALPYAAVAGALIPDTGGTGRHTASLLAGAAAATAAAIVARVAVGEAGPVLLGLGATGTAATLGGVLSTFTPLSLAQSAAVVVALALLLSPVIPSLAFWLAGLRLPDVPTSAEEIGRAAHSVPDEAMAERTGLAEDHVTALYAALAALCVAGLTWLAGGDGRAGKVFALVVCVLLALRFRMLTNTWQRVAVAVPSVYATLLLAIRAAAWLPPVPRLAGGMLGLVALACGLLVAARVLPDRRPRPYWGRAAELSETVLGAALLPLVLWVLDIYSLVRGLGG
jgi:type VII secretion integral membrane protein EccD